MIEQIRKEAFWSTFVLRPDAEALVTVRWRNSKFEYEIVKAVTMSGLTSLSNAQPFLIHCIRSSSTITIF